MTDQPTQPTETDGSTDQTKQAASWDAVLAGLPEEQRKLYETHVGGLKSALDKERAANKDSKPLLDELEKLRTAEQKRKEAEMTEAQRLQAQIETANKAAEEARAEASRMQAEFDSLALKQAVVFKASEMGFEHPEDAFNLADIASITRDEDGGFKGIDEALAALEGRLPHRATKNITRPSPTNPGNATGTETKAQFKNRMGLTGSPDVFAPDFGTGGGVMWPKEQEQ